MLCNNVQWVCNMSVHISWISHTKLWSILQVKSFHVEHQEFGLELGVVQASSLCKFNERRSRTDS